MCILLAAFKKTDRMFRNINLIISESFIQKGFSDESGFILV